MRTWWSIPALLAIVAGVLLTPSATAVTSTFTVADALVGHPTSVIDVPGPGPTIAQPESTVSHPARTARAAGPNTYRIMSSCSAHVSAIRSGANYWGMTESASGTPVYCQNSYITSCGGTYVVGCNWGSGQRIALYMGGVSDDALLAAHEFGHNWYGHSSYRCASWQSWQHVMAPSMCG